MTVFIGPVYVAHPYYSSSPKLIKRNVELSAEMATALNQAGIATVSPLQESRGRESALSEQDWLRHGLLLIGHTYALVRPDYWQRSSGCQAETRRAEFLWMPTFDMTRIDGRWVLPTALLEWRDRMVQS